MSELAAILAKRRSKVEPPPDTSESSYEDPMRSDIELLQALQEKERQKAAAMMARVCSTMLIVAGGNFPDVYPLQEDSRFFMETLLEQLEDIQMLKPAVAAEVGCGAAPSGVLLSRLLPETVVFGCDISHTAIGAAAESAAKNKTRLHLARMDLLAAFRPRSVDLLVFLPPYVPTSAAKLEDALSMARAKTAACSGIAEATWLWAGGPNGTALVERFLEEDLPRILSSEGIAFVLFALASESVDLIERKSNGMLTAKVVARCNDPDLGGKLRVCVLRIERSDVDEEKDNDAEALSRASMPMGGSKIEGAAAWRERIHHKKEEARQEPA